MLTCNMEGVYRAAGGRMRNTGLQDLYVAGWGSIYCSQ